MSTNKNALIRYRTLDRCFANPGKKYFLETLIEECSRILLEIEPGSNGISRRQVQKDIEFMESSDGWNIELLRIREGKKIYFKYANPGFSINNMPLNEVEIGQLQSAIQILSQFRGMPQFKWMEELLPKLRQGATANTNQKPVMGFDSNQYLKGIELLGELYASINQQIVLKVSYQDFRSDKPYSLALHPYYLKQYNNRWFLFGYNPEQEKYNWNLALDRIITVTQIQEPYVPNDQVDWNEYFEDMIGVTKHVGLEPAIITLHFKGDTCKYVLTKPLHGSQRSKWLDTNLLEVSLEVVVNYELKRLLLSYSSNVKVISPEYLSAEIQQELMSSLNQYADKEVKI